MQKTKIKGLVLRDGTPTDDIREACAAWGISPSTLRNRMARGMTAKEALAAPKWRHDSIRWVDHHGNRFPSQRAMAQAWGLTNDQLEGRLRRGLTMQQALTTPKGKHIKSS